MPRHLALVAGALLLSLATTGCSSSSKSSSTPPATSQSAGTAAGGGTTVTVSESEFSLHVSQTAFPPGKYSFTAKNTGQVSHAVAISGPGVPTTQTAAIDPGGSAELTVTLQKGSYELWCPVDGHRSLGMDTHIQVS